MQVIFESLFHSSAFPIGSLALLYNIVLEKIKQTNLPANACEEDKI
jgi:hypothetical protein